MPFPERLDHLFCRRGGSYVDQLEPDWLWLLNAPIRYEELLPARVYELRVEPPGVLWFAKRPAAKHHESTCIAVTEAVGADEALDQEVLGLRLAVVGPDIQGNPLGLDEHRAFVTDVEVREGVDYRPLLERFPRPPAICDFFVWTFDEFAHGLRTERSRLAPAQPLFGYCVVAAHDPRRRVQVQGRLMP
jgi:hypothetical protein